LYENFFKDKKCGLSIEAGASNGILENTTKFFEEYLNWKTIILTEKKNETKKTYLYIL